jgi:hypothetical protein
VSSGTFPIWIRTERFDDPRSPVSEMALANRGVTLLCRRRIFCEASDVKPRCFLIQVRDIRARGTKPRKLMDVMVPASLWDHLNLHWSRWMMHCH